VFKDKNDDPPYYFVFKVNDLGVQSTERPKRPPPTEADPPSASHLSLVPCSVDALPDLAIAYSVYHGIKLGELPAAQHALSTRNFRIFASAAKSLALTAVWHCHRRD
jgi:hypothetical protein